MMHEFLPGITVESKTELLTLSHSQAAVELLWEQQPHPPSCKLAVCSRGQHCHHPGGEQEGAAGGDRHDVIPSRYVWLLLLCQLLGLD